MSINMKNVLGIVFANMHDMTVESLTQKRTMGSILFGGRYRLIDFPLSNMVNSGITNIGVVTKHNYQSLLDHMGNGRSWDLSRKNGGLHILPPFGNNESTLYRGRLEALYGAISFITHAPQEYVVMSDCDVIANIDFRPIVAFHEKSGADITVVTSTGKLNSYETKQGTFMTVDSQGRVQEVFIHSGLEGTGALNLNMYVVKKDFLVDIIMSYTAKGMYSFERDVLQAKKNELKIMAYDYKGYYKQICSILSYFNANMDLLDVKNSRELFNRNCPIYTKLKDNAPSKYGLDSKVTNSLIADGCVIDGEVENCVLFRGVKIGKGSVVKNSILMQDTVVGENTTIDYAITDKNVVVGDSRSLSSSESFPIYVAKDAKV